MRIREAFDVYRVLEVLNNVREQCGTDVELASEALITAFTLSEDADVEDLVEAFNDFYAAELKAIEMVSAIEIPSTYDSGSPLYALAMAAGHDIEQWQRKIDLFDEIEDSFVWWSRISPDGQRGIVTALAEVRGAHEQALAHAAALVKAAMNAELARWLDEANRQRADDPIPLFTLMRWVHEEDASDSRELDAFCDEHGVDWDAMDTDTLARVSERYSDLMELTAVVDTYS